MLTCVCGWVEVILLCVEGQQTQGNPDKLQAYKVVSQAGGLASGPDRLQALRGGPVMLKVRERSR